MAFTFFYRDLQILELAIEHFVPYVSGRSKIRVWDAGCATGMETYTLAILLAEKMNYFGFNNLYIHATDIDENNKFGKIITDGIYNKDDLKRIPKKIFTKYFSSLNGNGSYKIDDAIKKRVTFQKHDLLTLESVGSGYSLIICKNVLLHLQYNQRIEIINFFHKSLADGAYLVMENTQKMPTELNGLFEKVVVYGQLFKKI